MAASPFFVNAIILLQFFCSCFAGIAVASVNKIFRPRQLPWRHTRFIRQQPLFTNMGGQSVPVCYSTGMVREPTDQRDELTATSSPAIVTCHGERHTLWYVVDPTAPEAEQPAVIRTFSSRSATREDVRRFLQGFTPHSR
jgi:hypothetical protein